MAHDDKNQFFNFFGAKGPIGTLFTNLGSLLEENGKWSSMRFASLFATIVPLAVWAVVSIKTNTIVSFPESIALIVVGSLGTKAFQKREEIKGFRDSLMDLKTMKIDPTVQQGLNILQNPQMVQYGVNLRNLYNGYSSPAYNLYGNNSYTSTNIYDDTSPEYDNYHNLISQEQSDDISENNLDPNILNNPQRKPRQY